MTKQDVERGKQSRGGGTVVVIRQGRSGSTAGPVQKQSSQSRAANQRGKSGKGQGGQQHRLSKPKSAEGTVASAGSKQSEGEANESSKQGQTKAGHADKTVPPRKQTTVAHGEFQMPKPKQVGQRTPQSGAEEPKKEGSQAKHHEQAGGQGYIFHCTKAPAAECLERALFGAPKKQLQQMQGSIQEGSTLFLYNTGTQKVLGPFTALSGPRLDIQQGAWAKPGRKGGFLAQVEVGKGAHQGLQWREARSTLHHFGSKLRMGSIRKEDVTQLVKVLAHEVKGGGRKSEQTQPVRTAHGVNKQAGTKGKQQARSAGQLAPKEVESKRQHQRAEVNKGTLQRIQEHGLQ